LTRRRLGRHLPVIKFTKVTKRYDGSRPALEDITFQVEQGEFVFLTGASGAGKTTLLRLITREELPTEGQILVSGRNVTILSPRQIPFFRRKVGVVFQDFRLLPRKTVFENVEYVLRVVALAPAQRREQTLRVLEWVGLRYKRDAFPAQLSGGEQQRVAIARALVGRPVLLLADEPTGNLDPELSEEVLRLFRESHARGTTVLLATHDRAMVESHAQRVLVLQDGRMVEDRGSHP
jgi:cell division transport system ATP-binding protein